VPISATAKLRRFLHLDDLHLELVIYDLGLLLHGQLLNLFLKFLT
jgi:hypothetical protein